MSELVKARPDNPIKWLGEYLISHSDVQTPLNSNNSSSNKDQ